MIHINLNMIFYTHVKHSPTKTIYIKCDKKQQIFDTQNMQNVIDVFGDYFFYTRFVRKPYGKKPKISNKFVSRCTKAPFHHQYHGVRPSTRVRSQNILQNVVRSLNRAGSLNSVSCLSTLQLACDEMWKCSFSAAGRVPLPEPASLRCRAAPSLPAECLQRWWLWRACLCGSSAACPEPHPAMPFPLDWKRPRPLQCCVWTVTPDAPDPRWRMRTFWSYSSWCRHCLQTSVTEITLVQAPCSHFEDSTSVISRKHPEISVS